MRNADTRESVFLTALTDHPDADPDSDFYLMRIRMQIQILASKQRLKPLKKCSKRLIFHTFWIVICIDADPDIDFYLMRIRIFI